MKKRNLMTLLALTFLVACFVGFTTVQAAANIVDFELEIDLKDRTKYDLEFEVKGNTFEAKFQVPGSPVLYGQEAKVKVEEFMKQMNVTPDSDKASLKKQALSLLNIDEKNVTEFELEVKFDNGQKIDIDN